MTKNFTEIKKAAEEKISEIIENTLFDLGIDEFDFDEKEYQQVISKIEITYEVEKDLDSEGGEYFYSFCKAYKSIIDYLNIQTSSDLQSEKDYTDWQLVKSNFIGINVFVDFSALDLKFDNLGPDFDDGKTMFNLFGYSRKNDNTFEYIDLI